MLNVTSSVDERRGFGTGVLVTGTLSPETRVGDVHSADTLPLSELDVRGKVIVSDVK